MRPSSVFEQRETIAVLVAIRDDQNQVDEPPDAAASNRQQLNHTYRNVACIETMDAKASQKDAQNQGSQPVLLLRLYIIEYRWSTILGLSVLRLTIVLLLSRLRLAILLLAIEL